MSRIARPWYRKDRKAWFVTIAGTRHNLGSDKAEAIRQYHALMREPKLHVVKSQSFLTIADSFLEWLEKHRAPTPTNGTATGSSGFVVDIPPS